MAQIGELNALVSFGELIMVIRRVRPHDPKSVVAGKQALYITAYRLRRAKALNALSCAFPVEFVGVRRHMPCFCRRVKEFTLTSERVKHLHDWCGRCH